MNHKLARTAAIGLGTVLLTLPLTAQTEREITSPTGAIWLAGADTPTINGWINQGWRIVDLEVDSTSPLTLTVSMLPNAGAYAVPGWWWYVGVTSTQMNNALSQNNARLIDIETWFENGTRYYAGVMVSNTGASYKESYVFYASSASTISNHLSSRGTRIVDLDGFESGGTRLYTAITIRNTGSDARAWWWYLGVTPAQIGTLLSQNNGRLIDIERGPSGTYDCVMVQSAGEYWWYYYDLTSTGLNNLLAQNGARAIDIERRSTLLGSRYDVVMLNSSNELTTRVGEILRNGSDGTTGALLRRVGSSTSTLAALNSGRAFEPASTMKTLHHVHGMRRVSLGLASLGGNVTTWLGKNGSCPNGAAPSVVETLETAMRLMMENSDNCRTKTVEDLFGRTSINNTAAALGLASTSVNHTLGCGGPTANATTLEDLGGLHHAVATGYVGSQRDALYELMVNSRSYPTAGISIESVIGTEASALGLSSSLVSAFRSQFVYAAKGGNYDFPSRNAFHGTYFGYVGLPVIESGCVQLREYAVGTFFNDSTNSTASFQAIGRAYVELLRDEIRSALRTWQNAVIGSFSVYGAPCAGTAGTPLHTASGTPEIGGTVTYSVSGVPAFAPVILMLGFSNTSWNGFALPFDLAAAGAPGCFLRVDPADSIAFRSGLTGIGSRSFQLPTQAGLVGLTLYTQYLVLDSGANRLGVTATRGVATRVGNCFP